MEVIWNTSNLFHSEATEMYVLASQKWDSTILVNCRTATRG